MSFGFSVGEFIKVGELAYKLVSACKAAPAEYHELGDLCQEVGIVIESCKPLDPKTVLKKQHVKNIALLSANCRATLQRLKTLLGKYENLDTVQNLGKRIRFTTTKSERENIRNRLNQHILFMGAFFSGVQVETSAITVKLLLKVLEERTDGTRKAILESVINDPNKLEDLLKDFGSENEVQATELEEEKGRIKEKLKEAADSMDSATTKSTGDQSLPEKPQSGVSAGSLGPAQVKDRIYDPSSIEWFRNGGYRFLAPVLTGQEITLQPVRPVIRYSEKDEWLCPFPEGWSATLVMITRQNQKGEAVYYTFNSLSCSSDDKPRSSRAFFLQSPFLANDNARHSFRLNQLFSPTVPSMNVPTIQSTNQWITAWEPKPRFFWKPGSPPAFSAVDPNPQNIYQWFSCAGFQCTSGYYTGTPFDLGDPVSCEFAESVIGQNGLQAPYDKEIIEESLPENWTYYPDTSGKQHHIYEDGEGVESTVHPARYYDPDSDIPSRLPHGWDRRLDSWGNLFFVDHHTKQAVREDPRFSRKVDQDTGLPFGWRKVQDHRNEPFFYFLRGKVVVGTDVPSAMNSKSMDGKMRLRRAPTNGEDPAQLRDRTSREIEMENAQKAAASFVPTMRPEERVTYYRLFGEARKANSFFVTLEEALQYCETFSLPPGTIRDIFSRTDTNRDAQWNIDEFSEALHAIKFELERKFANSGPSSMTDEERQTYHASFEVHKHPDQPVFRSREIAAACQEYSLSLDKLKRIWKHADSNNDGRWNIDEFANAMHETVTEGERQRILEKLAPTPFTKPPPTSPPPTLSPSPISSLATTTLPDHQAQAKATLHNDVQLSTSPQPPSPSVSQLPIQTTSTKSTEGDLAALNIEDSK